MQEGGSSFFFCMSLHRPRARRSHGGVVWPGGILSLAFIVSVSVLMKKVCELQSFLGLGENNHSGLRVCTSVEEERELSG